VEGRLTKIFSLSVQHGFVERAAVTPWALYSKFVDGGERGCGIGLTESWEGLTPSDMWAGHGKIR